MTILQAAVGPNGEWENWLVIDDAEKAAHAASLADKKPYRWRIVSAA